LNGRQLRPALIKKLRSAESKRLPSASAFRENVLLRCKRGDRSAKRSRLSSKLNAKLEQFRDKQKKKRDCAKKKKPESLVKKQKNLRLSKKVKLSKMVIRLRTKMLKRQPSRLKVPLTMLHLKLLTSLQKVPIMTNRLSPLTQKKLRINLTTLRNIPEPLLQIADLLKVNAEPPKPEATSANHANLASPRVVVVVAEPRTRPESTVLRRLLPLTLLLMTAMTMTKKKVLPRPTPLQTKFSRLRNPQRSKMVRMTIPTTAYQRLLPSSSSQAPLQVPSRTLLTQASLRCPTSWLKWALTP